MADTSAKLGGIVPPLVTPLTEDGEVDTAALAALIEFVVDAGVDGLFVVGSSGEAPYLTDRQRADVVATAVRAAGGRVPVLAGALDMTAPRVLAQARMIHDLGADYAVVAPPTYAIASDDEVVDHYRRVSRGAGIPVVAYDIPSRAHRRLGAPILVRLAAEGLARAVKDSSGDILGARRLLDELDGADFPVLIGSELAVDLGVYLGCAGAVPGLANVDPHGYVRVYQLAAQGRWAEAAAEQRRLLRLYRSIELGRRWGLGVDAAAYGAFKTALVLRGILPCARTAAPQQPLPDMVREEIAHLLIAAGLL